jgi:hypothetical protein
MHHYRMVDMTDGKQAPFRRCVIDTVDDPLFIDPSSTTGINAQQPIFIFARVVPQ